MTKKRWEGKSNLNSLFVNEFVKAFAEDLRQHASVQLLLITQPFLPIYQVIIFHLILNEL